MQKYFSLFCLILLLISSCEKQDENDFNKGDGKLMVEAFLKNQEKVQEIIINMSLTTEDNKKFPVDKAQVQVVSSSGQKYSFKFVGNGLYRHTDFLVNELETYNLQIEVGGELYTASAKMVKYTEISSISVEKIKWSNPYYYSIWIGYDDLTDGPDYYIYSTSLNGSKFKFVYSTDDLSDNFLSKRISINDTIPYKLDDIVVVRRQIVNKDFYEYWNKFQERKSGDGNALLPEGNMSNQALGFFGIISSRDYAVRIFDPWDDLESRKTKTSTQ